MRKSEHADVTSAALELFQDPADPPGLEAQPPGVVFKRIVHGIGKDKEAPGGRRSRRDFPACRRSRVGVRDQERPAMGSKILRHDP